MPGSSPDGNAGTEVLDQDVTAASSTAETTSAAPETGAENTGAEPKSFLDAINLALKDSQEGSPTSETEQGAPSADPKPDTTETPSQEDDDAAVEAEAKALPKGAAQTRILGLLERSKTAEAEVARLREEYEPVQTKANAFDEFHRVLAEERVSVEDLSSTVEIAAHINSGRYEEALKLVAPIYAELTKRAGYALPDDLRQRVSTGEIDEKDARELAVTRARLRTERETAERTTRERQEREGAAERDRIISDAQTTVNAWAKAKATSDPDWSKKNSLVSEKIESLVRSGKVEYPRTKQAATALADRALAEVEAHLKAFQTPRPQIRPVTGSPANPAAHSAPTSMLEAIDRGLAQAR